MEPWKERMAEIVASRDSERREKTAALISESGLPS
jgi:hypothetical protein